MKLEVRPFELPPIGTNAYLVLSPETQEAAVFDVPLNTYLTVERILVETGYKLTACLLTHGHWDHTLDGWRFNEFGTPTYAHKDDKMFFEDPAIMGSFGIPGLEMNPMKIDHWVEPEDQLELLHRKIEVRHVPGHSPGSILFYFPKDGFAISGDALFQGSIGRTDFPGCKFEDLEASIQQQIYTLPPETRILPGHGPETTVSHEMKTNPFVQAL